MMFTSKLFTVFTVLALSFDIQSWCPINDQGIGFVSASPVPVPVPMIKKIFNAIKDKGVEDHEFLKEKFQKKSKKPSSPSQNQQPFEHVPTSSRTPKTNAGQTVNNDVDPDEYVPPPDYHATKKTAEDSPSPKPVKFCSDCGNKHEPNDKFCSECGKKRIP